MTSTAELGVSITGTRLIGGVFCVHLRGTFTQRGAEQGYRDLLDRCIASGSSLLLVDCRQVDGEPTFSERFEFGKFVAEVNIAAVHDGRTQLVKFALLGSYPLIDPGRIGEVVAVNRGASVRVTTDPEEAVTWLGADPGEVLPHLAELAGPTD